MAMMMFEPLTDTMPVQLDLDFDLEDLGFRTLSSEAPPAEALEPSLSVTDDELSPPLSVAGCDIWKKFDMLSDRCNSPVPRSVIEYLQEVEQETSEKAAFDEDFLDGWSPLMDSKPLRNDCMWAGESTDLSVRSAGKSAAPAATAGGAAAVAAAPSSSLPAVKDALVSGAAVKCEPAVIVKREPCEDTIVALSCGPVLTTVASTGANLRTGGRTQTSLLNKSEVSLLKSNNRSLLISSRTASASASNTSVPTSPVKNNTSERVKVQPAVMWGPWLGAGSASCYQRSALESDGDSPRPYTPPSQSESDGDEDDEHPRFKHCLDMVFGLGSSWFDDVDSESTAASTSSLDAVSVLNCDLDLDDEYAVAEAAEQMCRTVANSSTDSGRAKSNSRKTEKNSAQDEQLLETSRLAFMSDHSYHLSKGSVKTEHLGVQTPSDSEEEIDVVSVGDKQSSRASPASAAALPTNPSARDRQQLQRTMASAIKHGSSGSARGSSGAASPSTDEAQERGRIPVRFTLGERTVSVRSVPLTEAAYDAGASASSADEHSSPTRVAGRKRAGVNGASGGGAASGAVAAVGGRGTASATKRPRVQYQHRLQHHAPRGRGRRPRGDDNEPDPTEKRSLHNDMERQRRIDLRNLVDDLRRLVPDLKDNKRAAKVMILREAAKYCRTLREDGRALVAESAMLRRAQDRMMTRLSSLRRDLAAQRF